METGSRKAVQTKGRNEGAQRGSTKKPSAQRTGAKGTGAQRTSAKGTGAQAAKGRPAARRGRSGKSDAYRVSRNIGLGLAAVELVASIAFIISVLFLNMLPGKYLAVFALVLLIVFLLILLTQLKAEGYGIAGKLVSVFMSAVLVFGSYYVVKANSMVAEISGGDKKVDKVVVAVLKDNPAETIEDAAGYSFGVQYAMKGDEIRGTISEINGKLGSEIATVEYNGLSEQAAALQSGEVDAIIYNEAYAAILEEAFEGYSESVKVIYSHEVESEIKNIAIDVKVKEEPFVVYISGIDVYGAIETNSRSDVNILAVVNPETHQVLLVTTPRDYYVAIPGVTGGARDKLTHAGIYGVDASMATLGELYDTEIQFYARVNFTSLIQMVDALGGVDVYSEFAFTTSSDSGLVMDVVQGVNHFDGKQALAFSRERQHLASGDYQRGKNQQAVIKAMIEKAISPAILAGANGILESVSGNVDTNMSAEQIQTLIKSQLDSGQGWNIVSVAAEGSGDMQYCYSYSGAPLSVAWPNEESVAAIREQIAAVKRGDILE